MLTSRLLGAAIILTKPSVRPAVRARSERVFGIHATLARSPYFANASASDSPTRPTSGSVNVTHGTTLVS